MAPAAPAVLAAAAVAAVPARLPHRRWPQRAALAATALALTAAAGCAVLDQGQRRWIFQPSDRTWGAGLAAAEGSDEAWIDFVSQHPEQRGQAVRLHALWLGQDDPAAPVLLYLHGARWDVRASAPRMRRLHALGFAVLGIDYRGFGRSAVGDALPSETLAAEDARAAWDWLGHRRPQARRFVYGHSLGGAIAVRLASEVDDEAGLVVEGAFPSSAEMFRTLRWGWLPVAPLITQRLDAGARIAAVGSPVLVVHGSADATVPPALGRALYERARAPKRWLLVDGGSHHNTSMVGQAQLREAVRELFGVGGDGGAAAPRTGAAPPPAAPRSATATATRGRASPAA